MAAGSHCKRIKAFLVRRVSQWQHACPEMLLSKAPQQARLIRTANKAALIRPLLHGHSLAVFSPRTECLLFVKDIHCEGVRGPVRDRRGLVGPNGSKPLGRQACLAATARVCGRSAKALRSSARTAAMPKPLAALNAKQHEFTANFAGAGALPSTKWPSARSRMRKDCVTLHGPVFGNAKAH